ncbi:MAG TPA: ATP-grasp domain-containing protein, partial [Candidatus Baltobacteraceae bacterium]|nr:ATP-grasp domain-containing protein [Candidatus Baltobacteraceae bacterium]
VVPMKDLRLVVRERGRGAFVPSGSVFAYDVLYLRHFHPYISEALLLAEWAEAEGLAVIDRALTEGHHVQSKMYEYWKLSSAGLPVPPSFQVMSLKNAYAALGGSAFPLVAKGVHGSAGRYVFKLEDEASARAALTEDLVGSFAFQDYLELEAEYRVVVIGYRAFGTMRKVGISGDFRRNVALGSDGELAELPPEWLRMCEEAARLLKREFAGVDLAVSGGKPYILEVNRRPGFAGFEKATGLNVAEAFIAYVAQDRDRRPAERRQVHALPGHHQEAGRLR